MTRLAEMFNVNHFIVSQVNPHVVPFLMKEEGLLHKDTRRDATNVSTAPTWLDSFSVLAKAEALHRMHCLAEFGILPNLLTKTISVLSQKYSGDITIFPEISYADFPRILSNPTTEFMQQALLSGEKATWPKMSIIKNHCAIELALDDAVQKLRTRVVFEPEEVESRKHAHVKRNSLTGSHRTTKKRSSKSRPLSQNSAQEPLQGRPPSHHTDRRPSPLPSTHISSRNLPFLRHQKSRSLNTVLARPTSTINLDSNIAEILPQPRSSQDITSSGAEETSNLPSRSSSSTSLNLSSPNEHLSSPSTPSTKHQRSSFRSSSQPNTPLPQQSPSTPTTSKPAVWQHSGLTMTPATGVASGAESNYKRIFHSAKPMKSERSRLLGKPRGTKMSGTSLLGGEGSESDAKPTAEGAVAGASAAKRNWGLEIDIPGAAKGLVSRGKRKE